jgi:hypothetical protein
VRSLARVVLLMLLFGGAAVSAEPFNFALIGDYPYLPRDDAGMPNLIEDLRADPSIRFVVHLGDLHTPQKTECSEDLFRERRRVLLEVGRPLIVTPGDNDWADCKVDPLAQLEMMRRVFYPDPAQTGGPDGFALQSQGAGAGYSEIVENAMWERDGVVFATLHMIAPNPLKMIDETNAARGRLVEASEAWLDEVFRVAEARDARGVFLATQVNLWHFSGSTQMMNLLYPELLDPPAVFEDFVAKLVVHVRAFGRPVVLANGDTHSFRIDKPLIDEHLETIQTFTRVEGFGSPQGHWVRVRVEPDRPEVFSFRQELVPANIYSLVPRELRKDGYEDAKFGAILGIVRVMQAIQTLLVWVGAISVIYWVVGRVRELRKAGDQGKAS